jgi:hypothetical protein
MMILISDLPYNFNDVHYHLIWTIIRTGMTMLKFLDSSKSFETPYYMIVLTDG